MDLSTIRGVSLLSETETLTVNGGKGSKGGSVEITQLSFHLESAKATNKSFQIQALVCSPGAEAQQSNEQSALAVA